jgi:RimJ/RimL family protein N-acetyltransferase
MIHDPNAQRRMMTPKRLLGIVFIVASAAGIVVCLFAIFQTWRIRSVYAEGAAENLKLLGDTIDATQNGLVVVEDVLQTTAADLKLVRTSIQTLTLAIEDTNVILGSLADLTGTDLPASITAAQTSLASAQTSAQLIDNMLAGLARIPLLGLGAYQPEVPLSVALGDLSTSLDPLTPSLENVSAGLNGARANLGSLADQLETSGETTEAIDTALRDAEGVIADYQAILATLSPQIDSARLAAPGWFSIAAWVVTLLLGMLLFAQIGLLERGLALARVQKKIFVPADFAVPPSLETERFRLRMLSTDDVEKDYEAVMETQAHFHAMGLEWPREGFTLEGNLADLKRHQREFIDREAFAYTVVTPDESRVLGCVYINPVEGNSRSARVEMWVRASEKEKGLGPVLYTAVREWMEAEWPFENVVYPMTYMRV